MAAASMKRAGYERLIAARAIVTTPSSIGWRSTSSTFFRNSGSSSRNSTPPCARLTSPGRERAAADQPRIRDRVVRGAERPPRDERLAERQYAGDGVDLRGLEGFVETHLGEDRGEPPGEHGLAGAGRAHHQPSIISRPLNPRASQ